jgi:hypothetical protein
MSELMDEREREMDLAWKMLVEEIAGEETRRERFQSD